MRYFRVSWYLLALSAASHLGAQDREAAPPYAAPSGAPYSAIDVRIPTSMGHTLAGTLTLPRGASGARPVAAVITISGTGPQDRDEDMRSIGLAGYRIFGVFADSLGRRGIAVLRMDDRGTGASGGVFRGATSADFADDIRAALAYLRTRPEIDPQRLALLGHSEGAIIAPMIARTESLGGIVLLAGAAELGRGILEFQLANLMRRDTTLRGPRLDSALAKIPAMVDSLRQNDPYMRYITDHDPSATASHVRTPVLILNGGTDQQVVPDHAPRLARAFIDGGNLDVTMRVFPNLNHLFLRDPDGHPLGYARLDPNVEPEVVRVAVDWLVRRLGAPPK